MNLSKINFNINPILLTNFVFAFFPISFIFGNFINNINLILFCCLGIFHLKSKILTTKFDLSIKIIFLFFFIIFFSTSLSLAKSLYLNEFEYYNLIKLVKSIVFFRFFLMLAVIYLLSEFGILNFKYFFLSAAFVPILVSLDIIYQYIFGFDIIGFKSLGSYNSGFFGDELIAGGFIKNFSFFSIFFVAFALKNKNNLRIVLTTLVICVLSVGILFSGNRMSLILFIMGLFLFFLFSKNLKKMLLVNFLILPIILGFLVSFDSEIKERYMSYFDNAKGIFSSTITAKVEFEVSDPAGDRTWQGFRGPPLWDKGKPLKDDFEFLWVRQNEIDSNRKLFLTALDTWGRNKIFGNGIKSFRQDCQKFLMHKENRACSNHPHNYYLEILTETGIVGLFITSVIGLLFFIFVFKNFRSLRENNIENLILLISVVSIILELFPFRSTGSIFSTSNATYLILIASILLSYNKLLSIRNAISTTNKNEKN